MSDSDVIERRRALEAVRTVVVSTVRSDGPDLTQRQMAVLLTAADHPEYSVRELSTELGIPSAAVTRAIDTLSVAGFVQRRRFEGDARLLRLFIRPAGREFIANLGDTIVDAFRAVPAVAPAPADTQALGS